MNPSTTYSAISLFTTGAVLFLIILTLITLSTPRAHAQLRTPSGSTANIELAPLYPAPGTEFTARFNTYGENPNGTVTWTANGALVEGAEQKVEVRFTAPALGEVLRIKAKGASGVTAEVVLIPSEVDVLIEADTIAPYFYEGRRVPSTGSDARISAIPHLFNSAGKYIPSAELFYTWSVNNVIAGEGRGLTVLTIPMPSLTESLVMLRVESTKDRVVHEQYFYAEVSEPSLQFYPYLPLSGLSRNAVQGAYLGAKAEATVRAEPYGVARDIYRNAQYGWTINGGDVTNQNGDPQMITLRNDGGGGISDVGFSIRNLSALSQYAQGLFRLDLN